MTDSPVALFVFNRPRHTEQVARAIANAKPTKLFVVADGPRAGNDSDAELCRETRAVIDRVDWACEVLTNYADTNLGCKHRVASGLDWVFSQGEQAIIVEDDCLPDPTFFPFCEQLLDRYRDDERVHMISGSNVLSGRRFGDESYYFSRGFKIWGWATWARAWAHYDIDMTTWPELRDSGWLERYLPHPAMVAVARRIFDDTYAGNVPTWDYQWAFSGWVHNALAITPATNLVTNIGYDASGSHLKDPGHPLASLPTTAMAFPLRHPSTVEVMEEADDLEWRLNYPRAFAASRRLVMGAALGYKSEEDVAPFLRSLRASGYDGDVVLILDKQLAAASRGATERYGATVIKGQQWIPRKYRVFQRGRPLTIVWAALQLLIWLWIKVISVLPVREPVRFRLQMPIAQQLSPPTDSRFLYYRRFVESHDHDEILLTDVRDVVFQRNPFEALSPSGLAVGTETPSYTVASEIHNAEWVTRVAGPAILDRIGDKPVSCVGVTYGDRASILAYLRLMTRTMFRLKFRAAAPYGGPLDQGIHNVLLWTGQLGEPRLLQTMASPLATLSGVDAADVRLNDDGHLVNPDGTVPSIVHQYDRQPHIKDEMLKAVGATADR